MDTQRVLSDLRKGFSYLTGLCLRCVDSVHGCCNLDPLAHEKNADRTIAEIGGEMPEIGGEMPEIGGHPSYALKP